MLSNIIWKKLLIAFLTLALILAIFAIGYVKGNAACQIGHANAGTAAIQKENDTHDQIERKNMALPDDALDRELLRKWMRD